MKPERKDSMTMLLVDTDYIVYEKDGETLKLTIDDCCHILMHMGITHKKVYNVHMGDVLFSFNKDIVIDIMRLINNYDDKQIKKKGR